MTMRSLFLVSACILAASCGEGATGPELPASMSIQPATIVLDAVGRASQLVPVVRGASGSQLPLPPLTWSTNAPAVATVAADGKVTAVGEGDALITAAFSDDVKTTAAVNVRATISMTISLQSMLNGVVDPTKSTAAATLVVSANQ
jgi:uncharacterized protein YjdB